MINKDSDIEFIISRYLSKEATPEEIKVLDDWISATPENYRSFLSQKNVWEVSHPAFNPEEIDVDSAHRKVMEQILHPNQPVSVRPKLSFLHYWQQVAAILLLPLLILSAYLYFKPASQIAETYQELFTPYGTWSVVNLPDGSKVWLNAGSSLKYPTQFNDKQRVVSMQGEAYFEVRKDSEHPFVVQAGTARACVLGTSFNIRHYEQEQIHITLLTGSLAVESEATENPEIMKPGDDASLQEDGKVIIQEKGETARPMWTSGYFSFDDAPLSEVLCELGRWYNINVTVLHPEATTRNLHFKCKRSLELDDILEILNELGGFRLVKKENTIFVQ